MPENTSIEIDAAALQAAHMAFIESAGPTNAARVEDAVVAYLFSTANRQPFGGDMWAYPSLTECRAAITDARACKEAHRHA